YTRATGTRQLIGEPVLSGPGAAGQVSSAFYSSTRPRGEANQEYQPSGRKLTVYATVWPSKTLLIREDQPNPCHPHSIPLSDSDSILATAISSRFWHPSD